jgi:hypothetical protein
MLYQSNYQSQWTDHHLVSHFLLNAHFTHFILWLAKKDLELQCAKFNTHDQKPKY